MILLRSNRASLIITHEDGTTEENPAIIKSLGLSQEETDYFLRY